MVSRTLVAIVLIPLSLIIVWVGFPWFAIFMALLSALCAYELVKMAQSWGDDPLIPLAIIISVGLSFTALFIQDAPTYNKILSSSLTGLSIISLLWLISRGNRRETCSKYAVSIAVGVFIGGSISHAILLRSISQGLEWTLFVMIVTFSMDTGAFIIGKAIGNKPFAITISPSKTWEGAIAGFLIAIVISIVGGKLLSLNLPVWHSFTIGALTGIIGQLGDLSESKLKRIAGIKDSGKLLAGHGGLMDRVDSIIFNVIVVYYLVL